jgi:hypothetical protein
MHHAQRPELDETGRDLRRSDQGSRGNRRRRAGVPLVYFNDKCCGNAAELRSIILKARRLADDHAEQDRAVATAKAWLLAQIEKKRRAPLPVADTTPQPFTPERLAA